MLEAGPTMTVQLKMLDDGLEPPSYAHPGDAGADLRTRIDFVLEPGERKLIPTGVALALPFGYAAFIHPRSGLATKHGLTVVNARATRRKLERPAAESDHVAWCCHSSSWLRLKMRAPSMRRMTVKIGRASCKERV